MNHTLFRFTRTATIFAIASLSACAPPLVTSSRVYLQQEDYDRAIWYGTKALGTNPNGHDTHWTVAMAYVHKERLLAPESRSYADSAEAFLRGARTHLARFGELQTDKRWDAETVVESLFGRHFNQGVVAAKEQDYERAVIEYRLSTIAKPRDHRGFYGLAAAEWALAREADARGDFQSFEQLTQSVNRHLGRVLETAPEDPLLRAAVHQTRGDIAYKRGETDLAKREYEIAVQLDPDNHDLLRILGERAYNAEEWERAVAFFGESLRIKERLQQIESPDATTYQILGDVLSKLERTAEALAAYERALALDPGDSALRARIEILEQP